MMRTASSADTARLLVRRFYVNHDNLGTKNPVHIGRVWKDVKDWQFRTRQTLLGLKFLHRELPGALKGSLFVRIMDYSMDPQPAMSLPGTRLEQNDYQFDRVLNRGNRVRPSTCDLEKESVKFLEATYLLTRKSRRAAACGRAQLLANFGRCGMGRLPRKCKLRGPCRVTYGTLWVRVHFAGA